MANQIGVLLPNGVPGCTGARVRDWALLADQGPFSSLAAADRYVYVNHELMMTMAAAAAVTTRIRLMTAALLAPLRPTPLLGKQVATLACMAPGRVSVGVAIGNRTNDYEAAGLPWHRRGRILDEQLDYLASLRDLGGDDNRVGPSAARSSCSSAAPPSRRSGGWSPTATGWSAAA